MHVAARDAIHAFDLQLLVVFSQSLAVPLFLPLCTNTRPSLIPTRTSQKYTSHPVFLVPLSFLSFPYKLSTTNIFLRYPNHPLISNTGFGSTGHELFYWAKIEITVRVSAEVSDSGAVIKEELST